MKTDDELTQRLRRASATLRMPEDPLERLYGRRAVKRRRDRIGSAAVALALFVAVVGGSLFALRGVWDGRGQATGSGASLELGSGEYAYVKTTVVLPRFELDGQINSEGGTVTIETWWATDGSGRRTAANDGAGYGLPEEGTWGPGEFPIGDDVSGLSTDPVVLLDQLRERSGSEGSSPQPQVTPAAEDQTAETGGLWRSVTDLIDYPNATPELRTAIVKAAELIPGVHQVDDVTDPVGRQAYALDLTIEDQIQRIDVDPVSLQPLAIEVTLVGQTSASYQIFEAGIVDSTDDPPSGDQWLTPAPILPMPTPGVWNVSSTAPPGPGGGPDIHPSLTP